MLLYNSLTKQKETFQPLQKESVTLYVCGITPYDTTHLGHAFTYITFDALVRLLTYKGYNVLYTQNVTDINDRDNDILKRAKDQNVSWDKLAAFWTDKFLTDMKALNWIFPTNYLYASKQIHSMTTLIQKIIDTGIGYEISGSVYLDTEKVQDFGKLSGFSKEKMLAVAKDFEEDLQNPDKRNPLDITLWRASSPNQPEHIPSFESPWGKGRPGWHIECSAMATSSLGEQIDIHGGGIDLVYPHHESEIAQSETATGKKPFAKYWIHNATVGINGEKMSKSKGNLILISDLLKKYSANAIRWVLLSHHYRDSWDYREEEFITAENNLHILQEKSANNAGGNKPGVSYRNDVLALLEDDLNTPEALKLTLQASKNPENAAQINEMLSMLGFVL